MKHLSASAFCLLAVIAAPAAADPVATFSGAWFDINYPAEFTVQALPPGTPAAEADAAEFTAPDGSTAFYVHSPLWGGAAPGIAIDPATETLAEERTVTDGPLRHHRFSIAANDGSRGRAYLTTTDTRGPSNWTIGRSWTSAAALARYQEAYLDFRGSLVQYSD